MCEARPRSLGCVCFLELPVPPFRGGQVAHDGACPADWPSSHTSHLHAVHSSRSSPRPALSSRSQTLDSLELRSVSALAGRAALLPDAACPPRARFVNGEHMSCELLLIDNIPAYRVVAGTRHARRAPCGSSSHQVHTQLTSSLCSLWLSYDIVLIAEAR